MELDKLTSSTGEVLLFDFDSPAQVKRWEKVDDQVMGGNSSGQLKWNNKKYATFEGEITLTNESGFASVRCLINPLQSANGIIIRARGSKKYKFKLRTDPFLDGVSYMLPFQSTNYWQEIELPFKLFQPTFRGLVLPDAPVLEPAKVSQIGILISDQQVGPFKLDIDWIKTF